MSRQRLRNRVRDAVRSNAKQGGGLLRAAGNSLLETVGGFTKAKQDAKANEAYMKIHYGTPEAATRTRKASKKRQELKEAFKLLQK